ncbi:MAG: ATP-binding protein [Bacteroidota bacterium]
MLKTFYQLRDIGIDDHTEPSMVRTLHFINASSLLSIAVMLILGLTSLFTGWPLIATLLLLLGCIHGIIPLALNYRQKTFASRLYFLIAGYVILLLLPIIFAPEMHFQAYLLPGMGMSFFFFRGEIGRWKFGLALVAIIIWVYLQWHFSAFDPLLSVDPYSYLFVRTLNDFLAFLFTFTIIYIFTLESHKYVQKIEENANELKTSNTSLNEANEELERLIFSITHDLKAPLTNIKSLLALLPKQAGEILSNEGEKYISRANISANRLSNMIDSLLRYAQTRDLQLEKSCLNTQALVASLLEEYQDSMPSQKISWVMQDLPNCYADKGMITEVWENLISNAIKYSSREEETQIKIQAFETEKEITFSVHDNGAGFDPKYKTKLFSIFQRLHTQSEFPGSGIGLASTARIIGLHGGKIWGDSILGQGASFYFSLPKV